jgi:hypothetical protein
MRLFVLWLVLLAGCTPTLSDVDAGPQVNPSFKHAHNDYEHARPLFDALDQGFESVEADVYLDGVDIGVSHDGAPFKGSLKALYLEPLAARVATNGGSVHGDGKPFFLWIDLKQGGQALQDALAAQLGEAAYLTRFDDAGEVQAGAVTVIFTGDDAGKKALVERAAPRPYTRDSNSYAPTDAPADGKWSAYAVSYWSFMQWDGAGAIPRAQARQLENLVNGAHAVGRRIRIYASPETADYWRAAKAAHVDFIGADDLSGLAAAVAE